MITKKQMGVRNDKDGIDNKTNTITFLIPELNRRKRKKED